MLEKLYLHRFRNYQEQIFSFSPKINMICGENAQGKTNLLEAVFLIGTGRSFRTSYLKELIHHEAPFFFLEASFTQHKVEQKVTLSFDGEMKKLEINHTSYSHFNPLLGLLPIIMLLPEDIALMKGAPADRRRFLDLHLAQSDPLYLFHSVRYHKAMRHRNLLLKQKRQEELQPWEQLMVVAATYINRKRHQLIEELREDLHFSIQTLSSQNDQLHIRYRPSLTQSYVDYRLKELILGSTLIGPHRDDVEFFINEKPAAHYGSQGQLRSAIAALKLAQWKHLFRYHGAPPIFCIDDFGIHLDQTRQEVLLSQLSPLGQVFLTASHFPNPSSYHTLLIEAGAQKL